MEYLTQIQESRRSDWAQFDFTGVRILLVEDSPDNQLLIQRMFRRTGAIVDLANNGAEGVMMVQEGCYDLVLMDIQMPIMDGNQAMRILRESGYRLPIIVLTAHAMQEHKDLAFEAGCDVHISKPIDRELLFQAIAHFVSDS